MDGFAIGWVTNALINRMFWGNLEPWGCKCWQSWLEIVQKFGYICHRTNVETQAWTVVAGLAEADLLACNSTASLSGAQYENQVINVMVWQVWTNFKMVHTMRALAYVLVVCRNIDCQHFILVTTILTFFVLPNVKLKLAPLVRSLPVVIIYIRSSETGARIIVMKKVTWTLI